MKSTGKKFTLNLNLNSESYRSFIFCKSKLACRNNPICLTSIKNIDLKCRIINTSPYYFRAKLCSLKRKFIVLYNVDLFANSRNPHFPDTITDKITLYLKARVYTVLARQINKSYDHRHINKYTELLLVIANEQFIKSCS